MGKRLVAALGPPPGASRASEGLGWGSTGVSRPFPPQARRPFPSLAGRGRDDAAGDAAGPGSWSPFGRRRPHSWHSRGDRGICGGGWALPEGKVRASTTPGARSWAPTGSRGQGGTDPEGALPSNPMGSSFGYFWNGSEAAASVGSIILVLLSPFPSQGGGNCPHEGFGVHSGALPELSPHCPPSLPRSMTHRRRPSCGRGLRASQENRSDLTSRRG